MGRTAGKPVCPMFDGADGPFSRLRRANGARYLARHSLQESQDKEENSRRPSPISESKLETRCCPKRLSPPRMPAIVFSGMSVPCGPLQATKVQSEQSQTLSRMIRIYSSFLSTFLNAVEMAREENPMAFNCSRRFASSSFSTDSR